MISPPNAPAPPAARRSDTTRPVPARAAAVPAADDAAVTASIALLAALAGLLLGLAAFAYEPLLNGAAGITLGLVGKHGGSRLGRVAVAVAMAGTVLGPIFGGTVYALLLGS